MQLPYRPILLPFPQRVHCREFLDINALGMVPFLIDGSEGHHHGPFELFSEFGVAGALKLFGGLAIAIGLLTRPVAFLLSGEMAVAYFTYHVPIGMTMPHGFFPVVNGGDLAILFCFVFLYLVFAGPGELSLDARLDGLRRTDPTIIGG